MSCSRVLCSDRYRLYLSARVSSCLKRISLTTFFRGENLLFADADGATTFSDLTKLERCLEEITKEGEGLVCGSRAHLEEESVAQRTAVRTLLMYGFHACVWLFAVKTVKDTQCGFKVRKSFMSIDKCYMWYFQLIKRNSARKIFKTLHIERWAFDVEMLKVRSRLIARNHPKHCSVSCQYFILLHLHCIETFKCTPYFLMVSLCLRWPR